MNEVWLIVGAYFAGRALDSLTDGKTRAPTPAPSTSSTPTGPTPGMPQVGFPIATKAGTVPVDSQSMPTVQVAKPPLSVFGRTMVGAVQPISGTISSTTATQPAAPAPTPTGVTVPVVGFAQVGTPVAVGGMTSPFSGLGYATVYKRNPNAADMGARPWDDLLGKGADKVGNPYIEFQSRIVSEGAGGSGYDWTGIDTQPLRSVMSDLTALALRRQVGSDIQAKHFGYPVEPGVIQSGYVTGYTDQIKKYLDLWKQQFNTTVGPFLYPNVVRAPEYLLAVRGTESSVRAQIGGPIPDGKTYSPQGSPWWRRYVIATWDEWYAKLVVTTFKPEAIAAMYAPGDIDRILKEKAAVNAISAAWGKAYKELHPQ